MKHKTIIVSLFIGVTTLFVREVHSQPPNETSTHKGNRIDSLEVFALNEAQVQKARDEFRMAYVQVNRKQSKEKTKEAKHLESDANKAAREFRHAVRAKKSVNKNCASSQ